jgi:hypothetical protein
MNKKVLIIVLVILIIYGVIAWYIINNNQTDNNNNNNDDNDNIKTITDNKYLIIGNNNFYFNDKWGQASQNEIESSTILFNSYVNNKYLGKYNLKYGNRWNLFDNNNYISYTGNLIAFTSDFNIEVKDYKIVETTNVDKTFLISKGYNNFDNLISNERINLDIDSNGIIDELICVSNSSYIENDNNKYYNAVYLKLNGTTVPIIEENKTTNIYDNIFAILYINSKLSIVIQQTEGIGSDNIKNIVGIYIYDNKQFTKVVSN